jgi:hypothetical protein
MPKVELTAMPRHGCPLVIRRAIRRMKPTPLFPLRSLAAAKLSGRGSSVCEASHTQMIFQSRLRKRPKG